MSLWRLLLGPVTIQNSSPQSSMILPGKISCPFIFAPITLYTPFCYILSHCALPTAASLLHLSTYELVFSPSLDPQHCATWGLMVGMTALSIHFLTMCLPSSPTTWRNCFKTCGIVLRLSLCRKAGWLLQTQLGL